MGPRWPPAMLLLVAFTTTRTTFHLAVVATLPLTRNSPLEMNIDAPVVLIYEACSDVLQTIRNASLNTTEVFQISTPCQHEPQLTAADFALDSTDPLLVRVSIPDRLHVRYPHVDIGSVERRIAGLQPIFVLTGSSTFVTEAMTSLSDVRVTVGNFSAESKFLKEFAFPVPLDAHTWSGTCGVVNYPGSCEPIVSPLSRALGFLVSWFVNWNWSDVVLIGNDGILRQIKTPIGRSFVRESNLHGTRFAFRRLSADLLTNLTSGPSLTSAPPLESPTASMKPCLAYSQPALEALRQEVLGSAAFQRPHKPQHLVLLLDSDVAVAALCMISKLPSDPPTRHWLMLTDVTGAVEAAVPPSTRHVWVHVTHAPTSSAPSVLLSKSLNAAAMLSSHGSSSCHPVSGEASSAPQQLRRLQVPFSPITTYARPVNYRSWSLDKKQNNSTAGSDETITDGDSLWANTTASEAKTLSSPLVLLYSWQPHGGTTTGLALGILTRQTHAAFYQLQGIHLTVATVNGLPFVTSDLVKEDQRTTDGGNQLPPACPRHTNFTGYLIDIMHTLSRQMNFTYSLYHVCDSRYGSRLSNGSWTGLMGEVVSGRADIGLANIGSSAERNQFVSYPAVAVSYGGAGILVKYDGVMHNYLEVYFKPFATSVWLCTFVSIPLSALFLFLTSRFRVKAKGSPSSPRHQEDTKGCVHWISLKEDPVLCSAKRRRLNGDPQILQVLPKVPNEPPRRVYPYKRKLQLRTFEQTRDNILQNQTSGISTLKMVLNQTSEETIRSGRRPSACSADDKTWPLTSENCIERKCQGKQLVLLPPHLLEREKHQKRKQEENEEPSCSFLSGMWLAGTALMQQGQDPTPESAPSRMVFGIMWLLSAVLYASYTSNLVSYLTVTNPRLPISNLKELVESNMAFGTRDGSVYIENFKSALDNPLYRAASEKLSSFDESHFMATYEEAVLRVLNGSYAFVADYVVLDYFQRRYCHLRLLKEHLFQKVNSFVLAKDSPLLPSFNFFLSKLRDGGVLEKQKSDWWDKNRCQGEESAYVQLGMEEVCFSFMVLTGGLAAAAVLCVCELLLLHRAPLLRPIALPERVYDGQSGLRLKRHSTPKDAMVEQVKESVDASVPSGEKVFSFKSPAV